MSILRVAILILTPLLDFTKIIYKLSHLLQKISPAWHSQCPGSFANNFRIYDLLEEIRLWPAFCLGTQILLFHGIKFNNSNKANTTQFIFLIKKKW